MRIRGEALSRGTRAEEATRGILRQRATPGGGYPGHMATARAVTGAPAAVTCWTPILAKPAYSTASQQMWELIRWKPSAFKRKHLGRVWSRAVWRTASRQMWTLPRWGRYTHLRRQSGRDKGDLH
ncbi:Hypothetical predicted protein [Pelobates cultripes]|uniref:Uncharacterized protein n=1 Tax=Pelobates cultripes TaxID=61616 RepID=A0AAD1RGB1_PELCU|nr:Hypothetical predicted protein [Pelobates cultripes]